METKLKSTSTIFFCYWLGHGSACLLGIFIEDKLDLSLTMTVCLVLQAFVIAPIPVIKSLSANDVLFTVTGGLCGIFKIGSFVQIGIVCPNSKTALYVLTVASALGYVVTPLMASVFVRHRHVFEEPANTNWTHVKDPCKEFSTNIEYVYLILSLMSLCLAVGFAMNYPKLLDRDTAVQLHDLETQDLRNDKRQMLGFKTLLLCLTGTLCLSQITILSLLVTFGIRSNLHLNVNTGILLTSAFSLFLLLSRFINTMFANRVRPDRMFGLYLIFCTCVSVFFLVYKAASTEQLFIVCSLFGFGLGPHVACVMAWSKSYVRFTVRFMSLYFVFTSFESLVWPTLSGILMDIYGPDMFVYTTCAVCFIQLLLFSLVWLLALKIRTCQI